MSYKDYDQTTLSRDKYRRKKEVEQAELEIKWKQDLDASMKKFGLSYIMENPKQPAKQLNRTKVCLDMDIHKNNISMETDMLMVKFMEMNNLILTRIHATQVYRNTYSVLSDMGKFHYQAYPDYFEIKSNPELLLENMTYTNNEYTTGYCITKNFEENPLFLDYKCYEGVFYGNRLCPPNIPKRNKMIFMSKIFSTVNIIDEIVTNFDYCMCLRYCCELEIKINCKTREDQIIKDVKSKMSKYRSDVGWMMLKNKLIESPVRKISVIKDYGYALDDYSLDGLKFPGMSIN